MKKAILSAIVFLPMIASASIELKPGSSIVIDGQLISCQASPESELSTCSIVQDGTVFRVYIGQNIANTYHTFSSALVGVKEIKEAGLCK